MKKIKALAEGLYEKYGSCDPFRLCGELSVNIFKSPLPSSVRRAAITAGSVAEPPSSRADGAWARG